MMSEQEATARQIALGHATHDSRGHQQASEVVKNAAIYLAFLTNDTGQVPAAGLKDAIDRARIPKTLIG